MCVEYRNCNMNATRTKKFGNRNVEDRTRTT